MAIKWPLANGNWSNAANWNDGTLPDVGDDVHADGKTVTINQDITVASIRTTQRSGGTAGGGFTNSGNFSIVANAIAGTTQCLLISGSGINSFIGNANGGTGNGSYSVNYSGSGTLNVSGNMFAGSGNNSSGLLHNSSGTINLIGNGVGGSANIAYGIYHNSTGNFNITGNVTGGTFSNAYGLYNFTSAIVNLTGNAIGSNVAVGAFNQGNGTIRVVRAVANSLGNFAGLQGISSTGVTIVREIEFGALGQNPLFGFVKFDDAITIIAQVRRENNTYVTLIDATNLPNELPIESDVRQGVSYNADQKTGTLAVPDPSDVRKSVPTDNTVGTAELTGEDILQALNDSTLPLAVRLKNVATVQSTGDQITSI
jgi:hypothetical protein